MSTPIPPQTSADFAANLSAVRARIASAADRVGRDPDGVRLLPVSKTVPADRLRAAIDAGMSQLGENRVQEAAAKAEQLADTGVDWVLIGHLQTNKARDVASFASEFQALDSLRVAEALDHRLQSLGRGLDVLVQVKTSTEPTKFGLPPDEVASFLADLRHCTALRVRGLMTMAEFTEDEQRVRSCFTALRTLRDRLRQDVPTGTTLDDLSMGMSGDFELAVEEGATTVRVGRAIFGPRPAQPVGA